MAGIDLLISCTSRLAKRSSTAMSIQHQVIAYSRHSILKKGKIAADVLVAIALLNIAT